MIEVAGADEAVLSDPVLVRGFDCQKEHESAYGKVCTEEYDAQPFRPGIWDEGGEVSVIWPERVSGKADIRLVGPCLES